MPGIPPFHSLPMPHAANYRGPKSGSATAEPKTAPEEVPSSRPAIGRRLDRDFFGRRIDARLRPGAFHLTADALRREQRLLAASASASGAAAMTAAAECVDTLADIRPDPDVHDISIPLPRSFPFSDPVQLLLDLKAVHRWLNDFFAKSELERKRNLYLEPRRQGLVDALDSHIVRAREVLKRHAGHGTDTIIVARDGRKVVRDSDEIDLGKGLLHIVSGYLKDIRSANVDKMRSLWLHEEIDQFVDYVSDPTPALTLDVKIREEMMTGNSSPFLARLQAVKTQVPESSTLIHKIMNLHQGHAPEDDLLILLRLIELQAEGLDPLLTKEAILAKPKIALRLGPKRMREADALFEKTQFAGAAEAYNEAGDWFIANGFEFLARKAWLAGAESAEAARDSAAAERALLKARLGKRGLNSEIDSLLRQAQAEFEAGNRDVAYDHARIAAARSRSIEYSSGQKAAEGLQNTIRRVQGQEKLKKLPKSRERFEQAEALPLDHVAALIQRAYRRPPTQSVTATNLERAIRAMMSKSKGARLTDLSQAKFKIIESQLTEDQQVILTIMYEHTGDKVWTVRAKVGFVPGGNGRPDVLQLTKLENPRQRKPKKWEDPWGQ